TITDRDGFDRLDAHHRLRQTPVDLAIPRCVAPEPRHDPTCHDLENSTQRIAFVACGVVRFAHALFGFRISASKIGRACGLRDTSHWLGFDITNRNHMPIDIDASHGKQLAAHCSHGRSGSRFTCACALEHVTHVMAIELEGASKVYMTGPRPRYPLR